MPESSSVFDRLEQTLLVLTPLGEAPFFRPLLPDSIGVLEARATAEGTLGLRNAQGEEKQVRFAPSLCIGLLSAQEANMAQLQDLAALLAKLGAAQAPEPRLVTPDQNTLGALLATQLVDRLMAQAAHTMRLSREMAGLRSTYEHVQNAFSRLEGFVANLEVQPIRLVFENTPDSDHCLDGVSAPLRQLLPVNVLGLAALELHVADLGASHGFLAELRTLEDGVIQASWEFKPEDITPGWMVLPLKAAVSGLQRTPELSLRPLNHQSSLPKFSLGAPQALAAFRASVPGQFTSPQRSLALRAWHGLPGVRPPTLAHARPPASTGRPRSHEARIPFSTLRHVKQILPDWRPDFAVLELRPDVKGFLCHPGPNGIITIAALEALCLTEPSQFSTKATVHSPEAAPIEFAIAFSSLPDEHVKLLIQEGFPGEVGSDFVFSGWHRVVHAHAELLNLTLSGQEGCLYFATRMADKAPEWFAWATFGDLRQVFLGEAHQPPEAPPALSAAPAAVTAPITSLFSIADIVESERDTPRDAASQLSAIPHDAVTAWLSSARGIGFDPRTIEVKCPPSASGVALRRLPSLFVTPQTQVEATLNLENADAPPVEFAIAISNLNAGEVLAHANAARARVPSNGEFAFTGWQKVKPGEKPRLKLEASKFPVGEATIYLMTRFGSKPQRSARALAAFSQIHTNAFDLATLNESGIG